MNLGWYEIMDRIAMIQDQIQSNLYEHQEADVEIKVMLDKAQEALSKAYQYAGDKFHDSCEDEEML